MKQHVGAFWACASVIAVGVSTSAGAQVAPPPPTTSGPPSTTQEPNTFSSLGDIIVTARRRAESLQTVPISIAAIGAQDIANQGAHRVSDLQYNTPNVYFGNPGNGAPSTYIRGVGDYTRNVGTDTRVSVYVDGVPVGSSFAIDQDLIDIDRVEILRGPQGTLFGKNTIAGAINIVTQKPSDVLSGSIDASAGNYDDRHIAVGLNVPIADTLFIKGGIQYQKRDGYVLNVFDGSHAQNADKLTGRLQLRWVPTSNLTIDIAGDASRDRHTTYAKPLADFALSPGGFSGARGDREINQNTHSDRAVDVRGVSATADYRFDNGGRVIAIIADRYSKLVNSDDQDDGPVLAADSFYHTSYDQFTTEVRYESPTSGRLNYVAGLFYLHETGKVDVDAHSLVFPTSLALPPAPSDHLLLHDDGRSVTDSYAAFANATYALTDTLKLELGGRFIADRKAIDYQQTTSQFTTVALAVPSYEKKDSFWKKAFTPSGSLSYQPSKSLLIYARASRGYKSGGYNADIVASPDIRFEPEYVNAGELGFKSTLFNGHVQFNADAFISKFTDYQVFQFTVQGASTVIQLRNAGKAESKGFEGELVIKPTNGVRLSASGGYADAKFTRFNDCQGIGTSCAGQQLIGAPKFTGAVTAVITQSVGRLGEATLFVQDTYRDPVYTNVPNRPINRTQSINMVNASLSFRPHGQRFELYGTVSNLLNVTRVENAALNFLQVPQIYYTPPRQFELGVRARF